MNIFYYLLEANTYLVVFYVFYRIVLKKETFYTLNRFYLLGTSVLAFLLPLIKVSGLRKAEIQYVYTGVVAEQPVENFWNTFHIILAVYLLVSVFFLARLGVRLFRITTLIKQGDLKPHTDFKLVEIRDNDLSFSFMNYMFINPDLPKLETIIKHEQVHIRQRHSLDILFFEVLQVINWFNPLIRKMQDDMRAVHEFIADKETVMSESSAADYALFLIQNSYGATEQNLSSGMFNRTLLKDRIVMLNQQKSLASAKYKYALVLLLLPLMLCTSAMAFTKDYGFIDLLPRKNDAVLIKAANEFIEFQKETFQQDTIKRKSPPAPAKKGLKQAPTPPVAPGDSKVSSKSVPPPPSPMPPASKKLSQQAPPPPPMAPVNSPKQAPPPPPVPPVKKASVVLFDVLEKTEASKIKEAINVQSAKEIVFEKNAGKSVENGSTIGVTVENETKAGKDSSPKVIKAIEVK